jgi:hypothetical protein
MPKNVKKKKPKSLQLTRHIEHNAIKNENKTSEKGVAYI